MEREGREEREERNVKKGDFDDFTEHLDGLFGAADVVIGDVGLLFDRHHRHRRIDLWRQRNLDRILGSIDTGEIARQANKQSRRGQRLSVEKRGSEKEKREEEGNRARESKPDTHTFFNVSRGDFLAEPDNELGDLLDVDDVFGVFGARVQDLCASCHLSTDTNEKK